MRCSFLFLSPVCNKCDLTPHFIITYYAKKISIEGHVEMTYNRDKDKYLGYYLNRKRERDRQRERETQRDAERKKTQRGREREIEQKFKWDILKGFSIVLILTKSLLCNLSHYLSFTRIAYMTINFSFFLSSFLSSIFLYVYLVYLHFYLSINLNISSFTKRTRFKTKIVSGIFQ